MNENKKSEECIKLEKFVLDFQKELSKEEKNLNKINEMYSSLKSRIKEYYSSKENTLTEDEKKLLETIIEVIINLPSGLEQDNFEELVDLCNAPYMKDIHIAKRLNMLVQRLSTNGVSNENCRRIIDKISNIQYIENEEFSREKFDWCILALKSNFVMKLPLEILEENIEWLVNIYEGMASRGFSRRVFNEVSVEKIDKIIDKISFFIDDVDIFKRYFEYLLSNSENAIINNNFAATIFGLVNPILDDERLIEFKRIIELEKQKYQYPDMSKYSKFIPYDYNQPFEKMDKDTFDEFCKDLEKIKILKGIIPEEYCDYLVNRKLDESSHLNVELDRYFSIFKRAYEDRIRHLLEKKNIINCAIFFRDNDIARSKNIVAHIYKGERILVLEEERLRNLSKSNFGITATIHHEIRHIKQPELMNETDLSKIDGNIYNMIKEDIIWSEDRKFYELNYYRMYCEIDARYAGAIEQADDLIYLGVNPKEEIDFEGYNRHLLRNSKDVITAITRKELRMASDKIDFDGNIISINDRLREILKEKPEFLEKFPALQLEFDKNGERKPTIDILKEASVQTNSNIQDIYTKIFECRNTVEPSVAIQTLDALTEWLQSSETISDITLEYIKLIIENEILNSIFQCDREDEKFDILVQRLKEFLGNNIGLGITDSINDKLQKFLENGYIELRYKQDEFLTNRAINQIFQRKIASIEDFKKAIEDIKQLTEFEYCNAKDLVMNIPNALRDDAYRVLESYLNSEHLELLKSMVNREDERKALTDIGKSTDPTDISKGKQAVLWFVNRLKNMGKSIKTIFNVRPEDR